MTAYGTCKSIYRSLIPPGKRDWLFQKTPRRLQPLRTKIIRLLEHFARHDEIYDNDYYRTIVEPTMEMSAMIIAKSIADTLNPKSVVDVGCGSGALLEQLASKGISTTGLEYAAAAVQICENRGLKVFKFDIEHDEPPDLRCDVAVSTEVAEHLPAHCADRFVDLLCKLSPIVVLTAATPCQDPLGHGTDHINEQPNEYWIAKFAQRGYRICTEISMTWREVWQRSSVAHCFWNSLMVFRAESENQAD